MAGGDNGQQREFNPLLDPGRRPGLFSIIGAIQGRPTLQQELLRQQLEADQQQAFALGSARQQGFSALQQEIQRAGGNVQRGVLNFLGTPTGQEVFINDPDFFQEAERVLRFTEAPTQAREREAFAEQAGVPVEDVAQLELLRQQVEIRLKLAEEEAKLAEARTGAGGLKERALNQLETMGVVDEVTKLKLAAGILVPQTYRDEFGTTSVVIADLTQGGAPVQTIRDPSPEVQQLLSEGTEGAVEPPAEKPEQPTPGSVDAEKTVSILNEANKAAGEGPVPADIIRGVGTFPKLAELALGIVGQIDPTHSGELVRSRRNYFRQIIASVGAMNRATSDRLPADLLRQATSIVDVMGFLPNPNQAGQSLLDLHGILDRLAAESERTIETGRTPEERRAAVNDLREIRQLQAILPTQESLVEEMEKIKVEDPLAEVEREIEGAVSGVEGRLQGGPPVQSPPAPVPSPGLPPSAAVAPTEPVTPADRLASGFAAIPELAMEGLRNLEGQADFLGGMISDAIPGPVKGVTRRFVKEPLMNLAAGFNHQLAKAIGGGVNDVDNLLRYLGTEGFLEAPGNGEQQVKNAMEALGIAATDDTESFFNQFGKGTFDATLSLAVMLAAAPTLAAAEGIPVAQFLGRELQTLVAKNPGLMVMMETGSLTSLTAGMPLVRSYTEALPPEVASVIDAAAGITLGTFGAMVGAGLATSARRQVARMFPETNKPFMTRVLRRSVTGREGTELELSPLRNAAEAAIEAEQQKVKFGINRAVNAFARAALPGGDRNALVKPERAMANLVKNLRSTFKASRTHENRLWAKVDRKRDMTDGLQPLIGFVNRAVKRAGADPSVAARQVPMKYVNVVRSWLGKGGELKKRTVNDLMNLRSAMLSDVRAERGTDSQIGFMKRFSAKILDAIESQYPGDAALVEARAYSQWQADFFDNPALRPIIHASKTATARDLVEPLMKQFIVEGRTGLTGEPAAKLLPAIDTRLGKETLQKNMEAMVRNEFGAIAREANTVASAQSGELAGRLSAAGAGTKFLNSPQAKNMLKALPKLYTEAQITNEKLRTAIQQADDISRSAFARFSNREPAEAISRIMSSSDKANLTRQLTTFMRARGDDEAERALQNGMIEWLFRGRDPADITMNFVNSRLREPGVTDAMREAFGPVKFGRFMRLVETATTREQSGKSNLLSRLLTQSVRRVSQIGGAAIGRMFGTGTIQVPGIISNMAGRATDFLFARMPPHRLFELALQDPAFERLLLKSDPVTLDQALLMVRTMNKTIGMVNGLTLLEGEPADEQGLNP